jgi:hypothetical protein
MDNQKLIDELKGEYLQVKELPDGTIAALGELYSTRAILLGVNQVGFESRFCFEDRELATAQFELLQSEDDIPVGWVARRPEIPGIDAALESLLSRIKAGQEFPDACSVTAYRHCVNHDRLREAYDAHCLRRQSHGE